MATSRRGFLHTAAALTLGGCDRSGGESVPPTDPAPPAGDEAQKHEVAFVHGVASGDPRADRVILWTRVTTDEEPEVAWKVAEDPGFERVVQSGSVRALAARDHTVKVDVIGLAPGRPYYYRFVHGEAHSPIGRTRTLPIGEVSRARFAVVSCSNYPHGHFSAYASIATRADLDAVLHLGDYLYEYAPGVYGRGDELARTPDPPHEIVTLEDYRRRHAQYKSDPDLQEAHRQHPFIVIWDDHESANNSWTGGAENHSSDQGDWEARKQAAIQAYFEWLPIRESEIDARGRIHRSFRYGDLAHLVMLDTRLYGRDAQADKGDETRLADPSRSMLGAEQEAWLLDELTDSAARGVAWRVIGQQVMLSQLRTAEGRPWNTDMWDGYEPARQRLLASWTERELEDIVVLTGDIHSSWAMNVAPDPFGAGYDERTGKEAVAVELVTPAISSPGPAPMDRAEGLEADLPERHPHLEWVELRHRGYLLLDITHERAAGEWYHVDQVDTPGGKATFAKAYAARRGKPKLLAMQAPSPEDPSPDPLAP